MPVPGLLVRNTGSSVSSPKRRHMSPKKSRGKSDLLNKVYPTVQLAMKASPILSKDLESCVESFDRGDVSKGTLLLKGEFFAMYKVKKLTSAGVDVSEQSDIDCGPADSGDDTKVSSRDSKQPKKYVLKTISQKHVTEREIMEQATLRLVLEANYLARLDHPGLVKAKGAPFDEQMARKNARSSDFFIVTERMAETLEDRLDRWRSELSGRKPGKLGRLSGTTNDKVAFRRTLGIAKALAGVLKYLHDRNIVVLNLSPQTIGFLMDGTLQITDLSCGREVNMKLADRDRNQDGDLAKNRNHKDILGFDLQLNASENTNSQMAKARSNFLVLAASSDGIPRYVAPEAIVNGMYTTAADTYSWGLMLFEMLTLSKPYAPFRMGQLLTKVCNEGHRHNLSIYKFSKELEGTLQLSWHARHAKRPSMLALIQAMPLLIDLKAEVKVSPQA